MTKQDILDALDAKFVAVLTVVKKDSPAGVAWWVANVLDVAGDSAIRKNVGFYVIDEGLPTEAAYWQGSEPKPPLGPPTFQQELGIWLDSKVAEDKILFYNVVGVLPGIERARVDVMLGKKQIQPSDIEERRVGVFRDAQGDLQYEVIG